jgi:glycosyltransferase involved in cell wall biosynthesis
MVICKIWDGDYPWDIRVEKVAESLSDAGHTVHLVCRNLGRRIRVERTEKFTIHRLPGLPRVAGPLHGAANFPHPLNPVWLQAIASVVRGSHPDLILVRDIPLALPAAAVARRRGIPVVLDMAENYPAMLQDRLRFTPTGPLGRIVRQPALARLIERYALRLVDHVIVVVEESRDRLIRCGVAPERLSVVGNTPRLEPWALDGERLGATWGPAADVRLVYLGNLDGSRGIDVAIRAIHRLKQSGNPGRLTVIGDGPSIRGLREMVRELDLSDRVRITGRLPFREVRSELARADVGLIPHYSTEAWNTTIPNKLFDYMLLGLPVIVSDARPTARIVRDADCGEVFPDRDSTALARSVLALSSVEQRGRVGRRGNLAIHRRYNWRQDSRVLLELVETLVPPRAFGAR